eukprot:TRINITY_DN6118_c0_g1_i2.p1 TRINITY_DN6118_c0_g1~~TRINITY_DN6118_c0_g1_i2.p1  ORF type:complete len:545 (+),score=103.77 TRINITY_DN6118_c0_g1_i2:19-1653(+)
MESTIVMIPGSYNLKIGFAIDNLPKVIPHCIARRSVDTMDIQNDSKSTYKPAKLGSMRKHFSRFSTLSKNYKRYNESNCTEIVDERIAEPPQSDTIFGEEAISLSPKSDRYDVYFPIRYGYIDRNRSRTAALFDLEEIWEHTFNNILEIKPEDHELYSVVLVIPDMFSVRDLNDMTAILFDKFNFSAIYIHKSSICSSFGSRLTSACVVDLGYHTSSISCVHEGILIPGTSFHMNFGGYHLNRLLLFLLKEQKHHYFSFMDCNLDNALHEKYISNVKEICCHLKQRNTTMNCSIRRIERGVTPQIYYFNLTEARCFVPISLFYPKELLEPVDKSGMVDAELNPHDIYDRSYFERYKALIETVEEPDQLTANEKKKRDKLAKEQELYWNEHGLKVLLENVTINGRSIRLIMPDESFDHRESVSIADAIVESVSQISSRFVRLEMFSNIILTGGSSQFYGLKNMIEDKVFEKMPREIEKIDIKTNPETQISDSIYLTWKGAALMSTHLDDSFWIHKEEWAEYGIVALRENLPFIYDNPNNIKNYKK